MQYILHNFLPTIVFNSHKQGLSFTVHPIACPSFCIYHIIGFRNFPKELMDSYRRICLRQIGNYVNGVFSIRWQWNKVFVK